MNFFFLSDRGCEIQMCESADRLPVGIGEQVTGFQVRSVNNW